ncbi:glycosyltransferase family 4 protein [Roseibium sediminis]|uniref:glycosyltransferase family 4 protein n=1 Tax=Roseibium sediminis TaxID=1775174 RepID=UPI00195BAD87|nr:glycosyltransferase family 4 protein [Roseibium sediminis]
MTSSPKPGPAPVILQVIPDLETGGAERTTVDVAKAVIERGGTALVVSQGGRMVSELETLGARHIVLPVKSKNPWTIWRNAARLRQVIDDNRVDLIHARSRAPAWSSLWAARKARIPFVTTYHGIYGQKSAPKAFYNSVMARGDVVIANSRYTADLIEARHPVAKGRIVTVYRGSDMRELHPTSVSEDRREALRAQWDLPRDRPLIINLARLTGWKGQRVLIEAMGELKAKGLTAPVAVLAGDAQGRNDYLASLKSQIAQLDLADQVRIVGHCSDVPAALALGTLSVIASTEPEAFGRAAVEAQAAGVPVIVSKLGAVPETVLAPPVVPDADRTGWHVPPGDAKALASAIESVLSLNGQEREALTARALSHVQKIFSVEAMTGATLDIYERLLPGKAFNQTPGTTD